MLNAIGAAARDRHCLLCSADQFLARLVSDELGEPSIRRLGRALERLEVDVDHAEAAAVAFRPLEIIDERPDEIAAQFYAGGERAARGSEVLAQIGDAIVVVPDDITHERGA